MLEILKTACGIGVVFISSLQALLSHLRQPEKLVKYGGMCI